MKAKIAVIKDDFTWEELIVRTDGANLLEASYNAIANAKAAFAFYDREGEYPMNIISLHVLGIWEGGTDV